MVADVFAQYQGSYYNRVQGDDINNWPGIAAGVGPTSRSLKALSYRLGFPRYARWDGMGVVVLSKSHQGCVLLSAAVVRLSGQFSFIMFPEVLCLDCSVF